MLVKPLLNVMVCVPNYNPEIDIMLGQAILNRFAIAQEK